MYNGTYLKATFLPAPQPSKRAQEVQWATTTITSAPTDDAFPQYKGWTADSTLYVSIDVLHNGTGLATRPSKATRRLLPADSWSWWRARCTTSCSKWN